MLSRAALFFLMLVVNSTASAQFFGGGGGPAGATEVTQIANNLQLVASYGQQTQQTLYQFQQYLAMLRNLQKFTPSSKLDSAAQVLWQNQNMNQRFRNLFTIVRGGQSVAYTSQNLDSQLRQTNPGYGNYLNNNGFDLQNAYRNWSDNTQNAVTGAMQLTSAHAEDMQSEADTVSQLSSMSNTADGQMQAVQAGNQIGIAMIGQLQKLHELQMAQMNAQNQAALSASGKQGLSEANVKRLMKATGGCTKIVAFDAVDRSCN